MLFPLDILLDHVSWGVGGHPAGELRFPGIDKLNFRGLIVNRYSPYELSLLFAHVGSLLNYCLPP